jgi:hypothetical protein
MAIWQISGQMNAKRLLSTPSSLSQKRQVIKSSKEEHSEPLGQSLKFDYYKVSFPFKHTEAWRF